MRVRGAVLRRMGAPAPYADSRPLELAELELAPPGVGEVLVRVGAAGLCHSDLSVIDGSRPRVMPMVLGHEAAGDVVEVGPGVRTLRPGDRVVLAFVPVCGDCGPSITDRSEWHSPAAPTRTSTSPSPGGASSSSAS
ncbi:MAG TPA: alcohol dehydrogenase catalytic domain-containing protein, partial [Solirubrobacteraceae bacterium]|nr:alcohol dehydrogenase catalytic domain-containing protein [Solirubrobacteraceae bacterium]